MKNKAIYEIQNDTRLPIVIRPYAVTDLNFITSSWLKSHKEDLDFSTRIDNIMELRQRMKDPEQMPKPKTFVPNNKYYNLAPTMFRAILSKAGALIACDANDYDHIYGYMVAETIHEEPVVHWIYVKNTFRRNGIARILLSRINPDDKKLLATFCTARALELSPNIPFLFDEAMLGKLITTPGTPCAPFIEELKDAPQTQEDMERIRYTPGTKPVDEYTRKEYRRHFAHTKRD
jgi:hypothetical protein